MHGFECYLSSLQYNLKRVHLQVYINLNVFLLPRCIRLSLIFNCLSLWIITVSLLPLFLKTSFPLNRNNKTRFFLPPPQTVFPLYKINRPCLNILCCMGLWSLMGLMPAYCITFRLEIFVSRSYNTAGFILFIWCRMAAFPTAMKASFCTFNKNLPTP